MGSVTGVPFRATRRCTGYQSIVDAIEMAAGMMRGEEPRMIGLPGRDNLPGPIDTPKVGQPPAKS